MRDRQASVEADLLCSWLSGWIILLRVRLLSTNLVDWQPILTTNSPTLPFLFSDPAPSNSARRYYRLKMGS